MKNEQHLQKMEKWKTYYKTLVEKTTPKSETGKGCFRAFWTGGVICMMGQAFSDLSAYFFHLGRTDASLAGSIGLIFLTAVLTGLGIFDKIGQYGGAGCIVPITGFANAMVSPAMEFSPEGRIFGTGSKLFTIAGPVLVYGISASVLAGILYYFIRW